MHKPMLFVFFGLFNLAIAQHGFDWQTLGEKTFGTYCSGCHQASGQGLPGNFPPHAGHLPNIVAKDGGRQYLIRVLLNGLQGEIVVKGQTYNGIMPSWNALKDDEIAAALNYALHSWGNDALLPDDFMPLLPEEVAAERGNKLSASDVYQQRTLLELKPED